MPSHVHVNKLGLTYKGTIGVSTATLPDVCKTPSPTGPVPIPYPNFANQSSLKNGTKTVKAKGKMIAVKGSEYSMSFGDEPGTAGGVKSSTFKKETSWITYSFDVKMDGKNVCRHTDKKFHNHKNTVDLAGNIDPVPPVIPEPPGDCTPQQYAELTGKVRKAKRHVARVGPCRLGDSKAALKVKGQAYQALADARSKREDTCFRGGDAGHRRQIRDVKEHVRRCQYILKHGKAPRWRFPS